VNKKIKLRSDEHTSVPGFGTTSWPTLELDWGRKWVNPASASRSMMFGLNGLPPSDLNQARGPVTSLKEEPLTARWMQPDQTK
jgi:hypothetical protein